MGLACSGIESALLTNSCCRYTVLCPRKKSPHGGRKFRKGMCAPCRHPPAGQIPPGKPMQGPRILPRTGENRHWYAVHKLPPVFPARQGGQTICTHQPHKPRARKARLQHPHCIHRITCADSAFDIRGNNAPPICQLAGRGQACRQGRHI